MTRRRQARARPRGSSIRAPGRSSKWAGRTKACQYHTEVRVDLDDVPLPG